MKLKKIFNLNKKIKAEILTYLKNRKKSKYLTKFSKEIIDNLELNGSVIIKDFIVEKNHQKNKKNYKKFMELFGKILSQNKKREKIVEIKDLGKKWSANTRGYKTNDFLDLHTDGGSLASLFCIKDAAYGGESTCVNAKTIYDLINDQSLKKKLFEGFRYHRRGEASNYSKITKKNTLSFSIIKKFYTVLIIENRLRKLLNFKKNIQKLIILINLMDIFLKRKTIFLNLNLNQVTSG